MFRNQIRTSTPKSDLERIAWPKLEANLVDLLREAGESRSVQPGDILFDVDQAGYDLIFIEEGQVEIIDRADERQVVRIDAGHFIGELGMLMGQRTFFAAIVSQAGRVIVVPRPKIRELVAVVPELSDVIVTAFAARRRLLLEWEEGGLVIVGEEGEKASLQLREFASRNLIPHRWVPRTDAAAVAELAESCELPESGPAAVIGRSNVLVAPSPRELSTALGLDLVPATEECFDVVVVGAGPAGLATAVYAASEGLSVLVIEDTAIGGQAGTSSRIENYLGFPKGLSGGELAYLGKVQAVKFGARIIFPRRATKLHKNDDHFEVTLDDERCVQGRTVILANGVQYRRLPLDRLEDFEGQGVYYAATDLEARYCRDTEVVIIGGGNSAGQAAMFLSRYATCTHIVVRGEGLSATMSAYLSDRIVQDERIKLWTQAEVSRLHGQDKLEQVTIRNRSSGHEETITSQALFIMIGAAPNTAWLDSLLALDDKGFVLTGRAAGDTFDGYATSCPGVFAVGDIRSGSVKRVASAVGEGSVVVSAVHQYLAASERAQREE